ncbi:MAG: hypothetical protein QXW39_06170 [Candidatus Bathyarchaeia archaeon]
MPRSKLIGRGKPIRYRTIKLGKNKYAHLEIFRSKGKRGGHTVMGKIRKRKR